MQLSPSVTRHFGSQAKAYALEEKGEELEKYLHCPAAIGDLYYIQNLTAAIRAHAAKKWSDR